MQASAVNTYKNDRMNMFKRLTAYITFTSKSNETKFASNGKLFFYAPFSLKAIFSERLVRAIT